MIQTKVEGSIVSVKGKTQFEFQSNTKPIFSYIVVHNLDLDIKIGDVISVLLSITVPENGEPNVYNGKILNKPLIMVACDKNTIIQFFLNTLGKSTTFFRARKLYETIESNIIAINQAGIMNVGAYLSYMADKWTTTGAEKMLEVFLPLDKSQAIKILTKWKSTHDMRMLKLLGLDDKEIYECDMPLVDLYEKMKTNPYTVAAIPMEKCEIINDIFEHPNDQRDIYCGKILRFVYSKAVGSGWMCVYESLIIKKYTDLHLVKDYLINKFNLVWEEIEMSENKKKTMVYMKENYDAEIFVSKKFANLVNSEPINNNIIPDLSQTNLDDEQKLAVIMALQQNISIITGAAGCGKCLAYGTSLIMFDGTIKEVQNLVQGDMLMGDDSTPRNVLSICQGTDMMYKITPFDNGDSYTVNEQHILSLQNKDNDVIDIPIIDYLNKSEKWKLEWKGYRAEINFGNNESLKYSYLIGLWIVCGYSWLKMKGHGYSYDKARIEHENSAFMEIVKNDALTIGIEIEDAKSKYNYNILNDSFIDYLKYSSIYYKLTEKALSLYKNLAKNDRLKILAGIIDGIGHLDNTIYKIKSICDISRDFILYIARSCGFLSYYLVNEDIICIVGNLHIIPVLKEENKVIKLYNNLEKNYLQTNISVTKLNYGKYYGFELDGNHRFLLGDFTVTHNTKTITETRQFLKMGNILTYSSSFTGKATIRIMQVTNDNTVATLHRMIAKPGEYQGFRHIIFDEASMITIPLLYKFFKTFTHEYAITFIGDVGQLPPIGQGSLMNECIKSETIPKIKLKTNHRVTTEDGEEDLIIANSNRIVNWPEVPYLFKRGSNFLAEESGPEKVIEIIQEFAEGGLSAENLVIISPYNKNLNIINAAAQFIYNHDKKYVVGKNGGSWKIGNNDEIPELSDTRKEICFFVGDRIMQTVNNYSNGIMNGQEGIIEDVNENELLVNFDTKKVIIPLCKRWKKKEYYSENINNDDGENKSTIDSSNITLSYAITVHKSQGSEWEIVIFYMPAGGNINKSFLTRNLIYTGITRAKSLVYMLGNSNTAAAAIANQLPYRCEWLSVRLRQLLPAIYINEKEDSLASIVKEEFKEIEGYELYDDDDYEYD